MVEWMIRFNGPEKFVSLILRIFHGLKVDWEVVVLKVIKLVSCEATMRGGRKAGKLGSNW